MKIEMKIRSEGNGRANISLSVPAAKVFMVADAVKGILTLAGHKVRRVNADGEEVISADEVFPDACPAMALRGLRGKEDITQAELAARLGVSQNAISEMESGKRPISTKMAKRIGETFNMPYQIFL